jgi:hypothetical protein
MVHFVLTVVGDPTRAADIIKGLESAMDVGWEPQQGGAKYGRLFDASPAEAHDRVMESLEAVDPTWREFLRPSPRP